MLNPAVRSSQRLLIESRDRAGAGSENNGLFWDEGFYLKDWREHRGPSISDSLTATVVCEPASFWELPLIRPNNAVEVKAHGSEDGCHG